jgi:hypothetical protein
MCFVFIIFFPPMGQVSQTIAIAKAIFSTVARQPGGKARDRNSHGPVFAPPAALFTRQGTGDQSPREGRIGEFSFPRYVSKV